MQKVTRINTFVNIALWISFLACKPETERNSDELVFNRKSDIPNLFYCAEPVADQPNVYKLVSRPVPRNEPRPPSGVIWPCDVDSSYNAPAVREA